MTVREEHSVLIERPIEEVFAFATHPDNDTLWQSTSLETEQTSAGPVDVGTTFRNTSKFLGRRIDLRGDRERAPTQAVREDHFGTHPGCGLLPF